MIDESAAREAALRALPLAYSLALRLRAGGIDDDLLCEYLGIAPEALPALLETAEAKLVAAIRTASSRGVRAD